MKLPLRCFSFLALWLPLAVGATTPVSWQTATEIAGHIKAPRFPDRNFPITQYGAVAGSDATAAIRQAIAACHAAGGGHVVVPAGEFQTGAIHLLSNVDLHLADGATLRFSTDPAAYLPVVHTRWEGTECMNYSAFIYAFEQENIAVTGSGTLDGSASDENWWAWARKPDDGKGLSKAAPDVKQLNDLADQGVPVAQRVFGAGHYLRPNFFQPYRCRNVLIEGVKFRRSPMWEVNPVLCTNVIVRNVDILSHGPNNDGCDPDSSRDVLIEGCLFDTGDDCIAIKSGRNDDGRRVGVAAENLIIRHCTMKDGHGGVVIGSEVAGGCRNVFIEDCKMDSPNLERGLRFKSNARRGGVLENIFMRNVTIGQVAEAIITVDFMYEEGPKGEHKPVLRNVQLDNVTSASSPRIFYVASFPGAVVDGIRIEHCKFSGVTSAEFISSAGHIELNDVTVLPKQLPRSLSSRPPQGE